MGLICIPKSTFCLFCFLYNLSFCNHNCLPFFKSLTFGTVIKEKTHPVLVRLAKWYKVSYQSGLLVLQERKVQVPVPKSPTLYIHSYFLHPFLIKLGWYHPRFPAVMVNLEPLVNSQQLLASLLPPHPLGNHQRAGMGIPECCPHAIPDMRLVENKYFFISHTIPYWWWYSVKHIQ